MKDGVLLLRRIVAVAGTMGIAGVLGWYAASAAETINYGYDVYGRVVKVNHSGTVNNLLNTTYSYDAADNRTNLNVTGSPN